jgi:hypothetical protein
MAFSQVHDAWVQQGLVDATFGLHVVPSGSESWGQVEDLPVDVYYCDFEQYDPPSGFPQRDVCCIRTQGAWWIILTKAVFDHLQQLAQAGELILGLEQTITVVNERQIGAWLLARDQALAAEQALEQMDQYLFSKYGQDYASVKSILEGEINEDQEDLQFADESFGKEPLEVDELEDISTVLEEASDRKAPRPESWGWLARCSRRLRRLNMAQRTKLAVVLAMLLGVLILEGPRLGRLSVEVYGPSKVDLKASFPQIRWIDRSADSVLSTPRVSRSLFQALSHRNPFKAADSVVEVSVRDGLMPDDSKLYRWRVLFDETGPQDEITAEMRHLSGKEMRSLQNALSGYRSLRFIMAYKLLMRWGHNGRFIVIFTGLCLGVLVLLVKRLLRQVQSIETDMTVRDFAAGGKILESLSQDAGAAENLMRFNQDRRLRMQGKRAEASWEKETFEWVEHHVDQATGKTKRKLRDERLQERRKASRY